MKIIHIINPKMGLFTAKTEKRSDRFRLQFLLILLTLTELPLSADFAFCCHESENEFVIPKQITSIGAYAFFGCCDESYWEYHDESVSVNIQLNEGLTSIGDYAFSNIHYLREMELPNSLLTLGKAAFSETSLESMTISSSVPTR